MSTTTLTSTNTAAPSSSKAKVKRYHPALVSLHWLVAILIFATVLFAGEGESERAVSIGGFPPIGIHMILGITTLVLLTIRLFVRWFTKHPDWASTGTPLFDLVGKLTHFGLYFFTFSITITGIVMASQRGLLARVLGIGTAAVRDFGRRGFSLGAFHGLSWALLFSLILLHVGAALYHQFFKKDNLLGRMWFGKQAE